MQDPVNEIQFYDIYDVWYTPWYKTTYFYIALTCIVLGIIYLLYRWYRNRKRVVVKLSPVQKATCMLANIEKKHLNDPSLSYTLLTQTIKIYIQEEYDKSLLGATDDEFINYILTQKFLTEDLVKDIVTLFEGSNFIKFAGQEAQHEELQRALNLAMTILKAVSNQER